MEPHQIRQLRSSAKEACGLLSVLAHEDRLLLLCQLSRGEHSVGELEEAVDLHQPSLSQHLGVLRREGLVETRRDGKKIIYSLKSREALAIIESLYSQFCGRPPALRPRSSKTDSPARTKRSPASQGHGASNAGRGGGLAGGGSPR